MPSTHPQADNTVKNLLAALKACADWIEQTVGPCPITDDDWDDGHNELSDARQAIKEAEEKGCAS